MKNKIGKRKRLFNKKPICHWCKEKIESLNEATLDHIIPGKPDNDGNIVLSCKICNNIKGQWQNPYIGIITRIWYLKKQIRAKLSNRKRLRKRYLMLMKYERIFHEKHIAWHCNDSECDDAIRV